VVWDILDALLGRSVIAQVISVGAGGAVGLWVYVRAVLAMRVPEAQQVRRLVLSRLGGEPELAG
jgi:putative peptidoglycan lipid II flippase